MEKRKEVLNMTERDIEGLRTAVAVSCTCVMEARDGKLNPNQHRERMQELADLIANNQEGLSTLKELQPKI